MADFEVVIDESLDLVRVTVTGQFEIADAARLEAAIVAAPGFEPGMDSLIDSRPSHTAISTDELRATRATPLHAPERGTGFRIANVVATDMAFGTGRMFEVFSEDESFEYRVFHDMDEAIGWLRGDSDAEAGATS
jgi:hypothetical protein